LEYVLPAVLALIGGLVGSLIAPIVQWSIEKRRGKAGYRREMIQRWRKAIEHHDFHKRWQKPDQPFAGTAEYAELRHHIDREFTRALDAGDTIFVAVGGRGPIEERTRLLDAIADLERKWGLL
jgi:hypothetical protein